MELNKNDIPYIKQLIDQLDNTGLVCKQDVMSLESILETKIEDVNINSFTTMRSSTNVKALKASLENMIDESNIPKEKDKDITEVFKLVDEISRVIENYIKRLGNNIELNTEVIKDIIENSLLTSVDVVDGDNVRNNLALVDISTLGEEQLNYILQTLGAYLGVDTLKQVTEIVNEINALYYNKPKDLFALLRTIAKSDIVYRKLDETPLEQVTIKDLINEFVVKDRLKLNLVNLKKEIDGLKVDLCFDKAYDSNVGNNVKYTYEYLYTKLDNLNYLLKDVMSINMVILFKILLIKQ